MDTWGSYSLSLIDALDTLIVCTLEILQVTSRAGQIAILTHTCLY
jgi:hypothetical protein